MPLTILTGGSWTPHPQLITTIHPGHLVTKPEVILLSFSLPHVTRTSYMYILKYLFFLFFIHPLHQALIPSLSKYLDHLLTSLPLP